MNFDRPGTSIVFRGTDLEGLGMDADKVGRDPEATVFSRVQLHELRISWKAELREPLRQIFGGRDFEPVMAAVERIHSELLRSRLFLVEFSTLVPLLIWTEYTRMNVSWPTHGSLMILPAVPSPLFSFATVTFNCLTSVENSFSASSP